MDECGVVGGGAVDGWVWGCGVDGWVRWFFLGGGMDG